MSAKYFSIKNFAQVLAVSLLVTFLKGNEDLNGQLQVSGTAKSTWLARDGTVKESETGTFTLGMNEGGYWVRVVDPHGSAPRKMFVASNWKETYTSISLGAPAGSTKEE